MNRVIPIIVILLILFSSCSIKREEDNVIKDKGVYPDLVVLDSHSTINQSESKIDLEAKRMRLFSSDGYSLLEDFSFSSFRENGDVEITGSAKNGKIELDGSSLSLSGSVVFSKPLDNIKIEAEELSYDKDNEEITTKGLVVVESNEGIIRGYDFKGDLKNNKYSFSSIEKGDFNIE